MFDRSGAQREPRRVARVGIARSGPSLRALRIADTLAAIRARGALVWGADAQGGAPFVFQDPRIRPA